MKKFIVGFLVGVLLILPIPSLADSSLIGLTVQNTLP